MSLSDLQRAAANARCRQMVYDRDGVYGSLRDSSGDEEATRYPTITQCPQTPGTGQEAVKTDASGDV